MLDHKAMDTDQIRLPDTNTLLTVSYTHDGQEQTMEIRGENAEHGPFLVQRFQAFLESLGFTFDHLRPPITMTKVTRSALIMLFASGLSMMVPPVCAIGTGHKPKDTVETPTRHVITAY